MKQRLHFLAVLMMVLIIPQSMKAYDFSAVAPSGQTLYYTINGSGVSVTYPGNDSWTGYSKPSGDLTIPSTVSNSGISYSVISIGERAFNNCSGLTSVNISNTVTSIGVRAFYNCTGLTSVAIPNSVITIGNYAFCNCFSLTSVTIPNYVISIGSHAFSGCDGLSSVIISNSVTSIGNEAFAYCISLSSVTIPNTVTSIGNNAFNCVRHIEYHGGATGRPWGAFSVNGVTDGDFVFYDTTKQNLIAYIGLGGAITIPSSVMTIGEGSFYCCKDLTSVTIPNTVTSIGGVAFYCCSSLTSITIPSSITSIGVSAFAGCIGLTSVTIPSTVASIGASAFDNIRHIEYYGTATGSPWGAFSINGITDGDFVFSDTTRQNLIAYIGLGEAITIPSSVVTIGTGSFFGCCGITLVTIPSSVTTIGNLAFYGCGNLDTVYMTSMIAPTIGSSCFSGGVIIIPCSSYNSYYYASGWASYRSALHEPEVNISIYVSPNNSLYGVTNVISQGGNDVSCDSTAIIRATANYGYHFDHWSTGNTTNPDTLLLTSDSNITAYFLPNQYTITLISSDESLGTVSGAGTYQYLDTVELLATPIEHYHFVQWTLDINVFNWYWEVFLESFNNPLHIVVRNDAIFTAHFAIDTHTVSVTTNDIARGMVESTGTEFEYGTPCTVTATAYTGYTFAGWSNGVTANPYTFAVLSDVELTALFVAEGEEVYTVTVVSADPSMGTVSGGGQAMSGGEVTIRAISNPGYHFLRWNDNSTDSVRTVTVTANATYTAYFEANNVGIDDADAINAKVYSSRGHIVVEGANGNMVTLYDITGRVLVSKQDEYAPLRFDAPVSGTYMIKIGNYPARKVVVIR